MALITCSLSVCRTVRVSRRPRRGGSYSTRVMGRAARPIAPVAHPHRWGRRAASAPSLTITRKQETRTARLLLVGVHGVVIHCLL